MIITSGYIEDMMITQELLKKSWIYKSLYLIDTCRSIKIYWSSILVSIPLDLSSLWDFWYSLQRFNSKRLFFFMSLYNPYRTRKAQGLCKPNWNRRAYLKGPLSSYLNKEMEKGNPNSKKLHKVFFLRL